MHDHRIEIVGPERTMRAAGIPFRSKHEVVDEELASALKKIGQRFLSLRSVKHVSLLNFFPRQFHALPGQVVTESGEFLFLPKQGGSLGDPFVVRYDAVRV